MPFYKKINQEEAGGKRTLKPLLDLRKGLDTQIPERTLHETQ